MYVCLFLMAQRLCLRRPGEGIIFADSAKRLLPFSAISSVGWGLDSEMGAENGACRHWFSINGHGFMRSVTFHDFVCGVDRRELLDRRLFHLCRKFTRNEQVLPSNIRYVRWIPPSWKGPRCLHGRCIPCSCIIPQGPDSFQVGVANHRLSDTSGGSDHKWRATISSQYQQHWWVFL